MSQDAVISLNIDNGLAQVLLKRPSHYNSFSKELRHQLARMLSQIEEDQSVRAVIIRGDGPGFCAGADLTEPPGSPLPDQLQNEYKPIFEQVVNGKKLKNEKR